MKRLSLFAAALTTLFLASGCCCGLLHGCGGGNCCSNSCGYGSSGCAPMYAPAPSSCPTGNCGAQYTPATSFFSGNDVMTASTAVTGAPVLASASLPNSLPTY